MLRYVRARVCVLCGARVENATRECRLRARARSPEADTCSYNRALVLVGAVAAMGVVPSLSNLLGATHGLGGGTGPVLGGLQSQVGRKVLRLSARGRAATDAGALQQLMQDLNGKVDMSITYGPYSSILLHLLSAPFGLYQVGGVGCGASVIVAREPV